MHGVYLTYLNWQMCRLGQRGVVAMSLKIIHSGLNNLGVTKDYDNDDVMS